MGDSYHVVAASLVEKDGKYLLVQEGKEHVKHEWNVPAGSLENDETIEEAAIREVSEEAGLDIELDGFLGTYFDRSDYLDSTVLVFVFCSELGRYSYNLSPGSDEEILDTSFFTKNEIKDLDLRTPFIEDAIEKFEKDQVNNLSSLTDYRFT